jgi:hypothetical protein
VPTVSVPHTPAPGALPVAKRVGSSPGGPSSGTQFLPAYSQSSAISDAMKATSPVKKTPMTVPLSWRTSATVCRTDTSFADFSERTVT